MLGTFSVSFSNLWKKFQPLRREALYCNAVASKGWKNG